MAEDQENFRINLQRAIESWEADIARLERLIPAVGWSRAQEFRSDLESFKRRIDLVKNYLKEDT